MRNTYNDYKSTSEKLQQETKKLNEQLAEKTTQLAAAVKNQKIRRRIWKPIKLGDAAIQKTEDWGQHKLKKTEHSL